MDDSESVITIPVSGRRKKLRLKCRYNSELRNVILLPDHSFSQLRKRLSSDYGFEVNLKYEDGDDGELIMLASQNDLDDLVGSNPNNDTVNIVVTESTVHLPTLASRRESNRPQPLFATNNGPPNRLLNDSNQRILRSYDLPSPASSSSRMGTAITAFDRFPVIENPSAVNQSRNKSIRWKRGEVLGQGAFGVVYLGLNVETGELMAVKQMATEELSTRDLGSLENEINLLQSFRHPNIVRYIGTEVTPSALSIFLEYVPGGSLKALIDKFGALEESVAKSYTRQLLIGLEYLHRNGIAHRDIKGGIFRVTI